MDAQRTSSRRNGRPPAFGTAGHRSDIHEQRAVLRSRGGDASARFCSRCGQIARTQKQVGAVHRTALGRLRSIAPTSCSGRHIDPSLKFLVKTRDKTQQPWLNTAMLAIAVASFAVGTALRVFAAHNDLWFDEI